jgi:general secretion pathway protein A
MNETFYGGFYGFRSAPFHVTPDPALLFPTETHRAALGAIEYGIAAGKGFIVITGEVGLGKTTVLRACLDALDASRTKIIYLFSPALSTPELYATILDEFDVVLPPTSNAADTLRILQRLLLAFHQSGTQVVLAVDEAQQMPEATLESLRILSNLETHKSKLLQIILIGQPELEAVLARHSLRQLAQRIAVRARIRPLSFRQSCRYILHRTRRAGRSKSRRLFTAPALLYLAYAARGVPRTINICCDNALINGYGHEAKRITLGIVRESCRGMKLRSPMRSTAGMAMAAMVLVGLFVFGNALLRYLHTARANPSQVLAGDTQWPPPTTADASPADAALTSLRRETPIPGAPPAGPQSAVPTTSSSESLPAPSAGDDSPSDVGSTAQVPAAQTEADSRPGATPQQAAPPIALQPSTAAPGSLPAGEPVNNSKAAAREGSKWRVREGDTLYKACRKTYGSCNEKALRELIAKNPEIGPDGKIHEGQVLFLPRQRQAATPN